MDIPTVKAIDRTVRGRRPCRGLRRRGLVPAVLYGRGKPNVMLSIESSVLHHLLDSHALVFNVMTDGEQTPVQLLELQYDSFGDEILHADLGRISMTETVEVAVMVETKGTPAGVRDEGGVLELVMHELTVESLPGNIPEKVVVDVSELNIGDDIRIGDLHLPEGVSAVEEAESVVVTCIPPMEMVSEEDEEALEEAIIAEPELIGREEEDEGEESGEEGEE